MLRRLGWCQRPEHWRSGWRGTAGTARRRRQFRLWYFFVLVWLAVSVAQGLGSLVRWAAGPLAGSSAGLQIPLMLLVAAGAVLVVTLVGRNIGSPLGEVVAASERVAAGDLTVRLRDERKGE